MLVDDDARLRHLVRDALQDDGYDIVAEAGSAEEALPLVAAADPDVIVVDYVMGGMDGLEMAETVCASRPGQPVVLFSSLFDRELWGRARRLGIRYIEKAEGLDALEELIDSVVGSR